ncbi:MAG: hypothetical protein H7138_10185 [Myxococcales bacterium]|nr:hypothetical protein [Myxococcales bacterium]
MTLAGDQPTGPAILAAVPALTVSPAREALTLCRSVAFDRIALAAAVILPTGITASSGLAVGAFFSVVALPFVVLGLRNVLRQPPLLRGDERGLWFGRGRIVPWHEVTLIYETSTWPRRTLDGIGFEFARRSTWLRLPLEKQVASLFAYGETAVTTRYVPDLRQTALVAQLQALRTRALGTEDGIPVGASVVPIARMVSR